MSRLDVWLAAEVGLAGRLRHDRIAGGPSNLTILVSDEDDRQVVVRRPPTSISGGTHDVLREARIVTSLQFTRVPVPQVLGVCDDSNVVGVPFYVMDYVDGEVVDTPDSAFGYDFDDRRGLGFELIDVMAQVQKVDPAAVGVSTSATPYLERQCRRWNRQWQNMNRDLPAITHVCQRLQAISGRLQPQPECLVHGDLGFGNVIVADRDRPRIAAVLDWELATAGHPLADLAWVGTRMQAPSGVFEFGLDTCSVPGFPAFDELVAHFAATTGVSVANLLPFIAFHAWRWAIIAAGVQARLAAAQTAHMREIESWHSRSVELLADFAADLVP